jgi:hypothetical protein
MSANYDPVIGYTTSITTQPDTSGLKPGHQRSLFLNSNAGMVKQGDNRETAQPTPSVEQLRSTVYLATLFLALSIIL